MKKSTAYFGNRFKSVLGSRNRRPRAVTVAPVVASEFEALESRILLSGLTTGTKVYKSLSFTDADGDKVSIKILGKTGAKAGFQVDSGFAGSPTNNPSGSDIGQLNLVGLTSANSLVVTVKPAKLQATDKTTSNNLWSPGYTNIGSITSEASTNGRGGSLTAATDVRNITLNAAVVSDINLIDTNVTGNLQLGVGRTAFADRSNIAAVFGDTNSYNPVAGLVDFYDISAKSIGQLTLNGIIAADAKNPYAGSNETNDFLGNINVVGDLGGIIGLRSSLDGSVNVGGDLGRISVGQINGQISVGGDAVFNAPAGFDGTFVTGGHLHLGLNSGDPGDGAFYAGAGISGLNPASETDTIFVPAPFDGSLNNSSTSGAAGTGVANIIVTGGEGAFTVNSANSVGNITGSALDLTVNSGPGGIGNLTSTAGDLDGTYNSAGDIGNLAANGGDVAGTFNAVADVGTITAIGGGITGSVTAGGNIDDVTVEINSPVGGPAFTGSLTAGGTVGDITLTSLAKTGHVVDEGSVNAADGIGNISVTANTSASAIFDSSFSADTDGDNTGGIKSITVLNTSNTGGSGITDSSFDGAFIGDITVSLTGSNTGIAIDNSEFDASTATETFVGSGVFNNFGYIEDIIVVNNTANGNGQGIIDSNFFAGNAGYIGNISVTMNKASGGSGDAIYESDFVATSGATNNTIFTSTIGSVTVINTTGGDGIDGVSTSPTSDFYANDGVGSFKVTAQARGINQTDIQADVDGDGIGNVGSITVTMTGINSTGIYDTDVSGVDIGDIAVTFPNSSSFPSVSGQGIAYTNLTASGKIGTITVGDTANRAGANGIWNVIANADGDIGDVTAFANTGYGIFTTQLTADADSDNAGAIGNVSGTSTKQDGINSGTFKGASVGNVTGTVDGDGDDGIDNLKIISTVGNIGVITGTTTGENSYGNSEGLVDLDVTSAVDIKGIAATSTKGPGDDAISGGTFTATTGNIDYITADGGDDGIDNKAFFTAVKGNIGPVTVTGGDTGIKDATFLAGGSIGIVTATGTTGEGIDNSAFTAGTDIGAINATGDGDGIYGSSFNAKGDIGAITATTNTGSGINGSSFTADSDKSGAGGIISITAESATGTGVYDSQFTGASIGDIKATVTGDGNDGIENSKFIAAAGNIGTVTASTAGTGVSDEAIKYSQFTATGDIGDIDATAVAGTGISYGTFTADSDSSGAGKISSITAESATAAGIFLSAFSGAEIGDIEATVTGDGSDGIADSKFIATAGNIGDITANTAGTGPDDSAIAATLFDATGDIATTNGIEATAIAGHTIDFSVSGGIIADGDIGDIDVTMTGTTGAYDAILGQGIGTNVIEAKGNLGNITIINSSTDANADGLDNVKIDVTGTLGTVSITAAGGVAMNASSIDPTSIGAITLSGASAAMTNNSEIVSSGAIASLTVTGDIESGSNISAGSIAGATSVTGDLDGSLTTTGSIDAVTVSDEFSGSISAGTTTGAISIGTAAGGSINAATSIGNIAITGTGDQSLTIKAPTVGNIDANSLADTKTATLNIDGSVLTIGNISVAAPTGIANLITQRVGAAPNLLSTLGNVTVDGNWDNNNSLVLLTQIGNVSVGGSLGGGSTLGVAAGLKITSTNNGAVIIGSNPPGEVSNVTFNVLNTGTAYTGTFTINGAAFTTASSAPSPFNPPGTGVDGVVVNLI